ncbi:helix-turn-helix transcriptional regulator [Streptomyces sp. WMMC500]|uniref:helix-turn-helix domain-containing protein n=1 Tax=Streptomyces sp. WMMC500 TaxID=3015154 RepID=UPI00248C7CB0|nr:helix-turn-helix transcriptional regulator [Streptomyces sp. WMMC500]WBB64098.1 helix-turn-helix transcriptional regulator [Streptomyces sp. WMMC500]
MDTAGIGRRIAYWRDRRGFTQEDFARLMGQSRRWVQSLEGGQRQADPRLSVLARAAEVLHVPVEQLLSDQPPATEAGAAPPAEVLAVVDALYPVSGTLPDGDPPALEVLHRRLEYCCAAFQACHYRALSRDLPPLLAGAQKAAHAAPRDRVCEAHGLLSRALQLATSFLHKYGAGAAVQAAVVADRALAAAERSGDSVQIGAASRRVAKSLMYQQRPQAAVDYALETARRLEPDLSARGPLGLSTLGMLYLNAALAAAGRESAGALIDHAEDVAARQGADLDEDYTMFGPTNVELHRVDMLVRFEDGWSALDTAAGVEQAALAGMSRERRARHHIARAHASLLTRRKEDAAKELLEADKLAPEEVESRPEPVSLVKDVLGATPQPGAQLRALARRCGLQA